MKTEKIKVGVVGIRGVTAGILLKYLVAHKYVELHALVSEGGKDQNIQDIHPSLRGLLDKKTVHFDETLISGCDLVYFCKSPGESFDKINALTNLQAQDKKKLKIIDVSADYRLKDKNDFKTWYGIPHAAPDLLAESVYGLTECYGDQIRTASLVANPGCYPTAVLLALWPLLDKKMIDTNYSVIIDAHSGVSGAGKTANNGRNMAMDVDANIIPYKIGKHQHTPEIAQEIKNMAGEPIDFMFVPHVAPFKYGLLATNYIKCNARLNWQDLYAVYNEYYQYKPFIRMLPEHAYPEVRNVEATNFCDIGFVVDEKSSLCVVMSAIDNVVKGAAGQAIQNMNIMFGLEEAEGLPYADVLQQKSQNQSSSTPKNSPSTKKRSRMADSAIG